MDLLIAQLFQVSKDKMDAQELIILMSVPLVVAAIALILTRKIGQHGKSRPVRWISLAPLVVGALLGVTPYRSAHDNLYMTFTRASTNSRMLHEAALFVPLAALLILIAYLIYSDRRHRLEH